MDIKILTNSLKGFSFKDKEILFGTTQQEIEHVLGKPAGYEVNNLLNLSWEIRDGIIFFLWERGTKIN